MASGIDLKVEPDGSADWMPEGKRRPLQHLRIQMKGGAVPKMGRLWRSWQGLEEVSTGKSGILDILFEHSY